jgi:type IV pilus assembly protein PilW
MSKHFPRSPIKQAGLSLIEMMIALTLGSIVTVGVVQLFVGSSQTYKMLVGQSRMQESGRFALGFIGRALRSAGYKGCYSTNDNIVTTLALSNNTPYEFDIRTPLGGHNSTGATMWAPALSALPGTTSGSYTEPAGSDPGETGIDTATIAAGTDVLTTRNLSMNEARLLVPPVAQMGPLIVRIPENGLGFEVDHFAMATNCENATIFRVTDVDLNTPAAGQATIGHDRDDADIYQNTFEKLASLNAFETVDTYVNAIETHIFYIAPGSGTNNMGDTPMSLWRKTSLNAPIELVEGVENLQVLYGEDLDSDGVPNWYRPANTITDFNNVLTVRVSLTVNSVDDVGSNATDGLLRRTFTETVQLRNKG